MKHVCHLTTVHPRYDIRIFHKECKSLVTKYKVSLLVADEFPDECVSGVNIYSLGKPNSRYDRVLKFSSIILAKIKELKPELVHIHDPELLLLVPRLYKLGIKIIYDSHEDLPKQILSKHWIPSIIRPLLSKVAGMAEKLAISKLVCVIAATPQIEDNFIKCKNHITIYNYPIIDIEQHTNSNIWDNRDNEIAYVGSISKTRGITTLIDSLAISKVKLKLAGRFSGANLEQELQNSANWQFVNYYGVLEHSQINTEILQESKIGIVTLYPTPSYIESLPIKMFEYMLAGIPIIASNFPMWRDIVQKFNCGILVDPQNPTEIAKATTYLLENQELAKNMGRNGYLAVINNFSWQAESKKLLSIYNILI